jgi:hypothetical protein
LQLGGEVAVLRNFLCWELSKRMGGALKGRGTVVRWEAGIRKGKTSRSFAARVEGEVVG